MNDKAEYYFALALQISNGDNNAEQAMAELYRGFKKPALIFIRQHLSGIVENEPGLDEEVYHEAFLGLYHKMKKDCVFKNNNIVSYMIGILKNLCADMIKRKQRKSDYLKELDFLISDIDESNYDIILQITIKHCMEKLRKKMPKLWDAFELHFVQGYQFNEIAEQLNTGLSAAKVRSSRFIQKLRECIEA